MGEPRWPPERRVPRNDPDISPELGPKINRVHIEFPSFSAFSDFMGRIAVFAMEHTITLIVQFQSDPQVIVTTSAVNDSVKSFLRGRVWSSGWTIRQ